MSVVIGVVRAEVNARCDDGRLVAVDGVESVESKHFLRNLSGAIARTVAPIAQESQVSGPRSKLVNLSQDLHY